MFAYYGSLVGRWRGSFELRITDRDGLRRLVALDRIAMRAFTVLRRLGTPILETSVALDGERVLHTTRVRLLGGVVFDSEESIERGRLVGALRMPPDPRRRPIHGAVVVEGDSARYDLVWLGVPLLQKAVFDRARDTVTITQETPFSFGTQVLRRVPAMQMVARR